MLNIEKYRDQILESMSEGRCICEAVVPLRYGNKSVDIDNVYCTTYSAETFNWLCEEYKEPEVDWSKVPRGTLVEVSNSDACSWYKKHFYGYDPSLLYPFIVVASDSSVVGCFKYCRLAEAEE